MTQYIVHRRRIRIRTHTHNALRILDIALTREFINQVRELYTSNMQDSLNEINLGGNDTATPYIPPTPHSSNSSTPHMTVFPGAQYSHLQDAAIHQAQRFIPPTIGNRTAKINSGGLTGWLMSNGFAKKQSQAIVILLIMSGLFFVSSFVVYHFMTRDPNSGVDVEKMKNTLIRLRTIRQ